jgi:DNA-binding NarL/FixJ family response regulator
MDTDLFGALQAGAAGYLTKSMSFTRLPSALRGACAGEAAMPRKLVARLLERFHGREPRWRHAVAGPGPERRLTSREWEVLELLAEGLPTGEIATKLVLSRSAVRVPRSYASSGWPTGRLPSSSSSGPRHLNVRGKYRRT